LSVAPIRVNAPILDTIDAALCEPDAASEDVKQEQEQEAEAEAEEEEEEGEEPGNSSDGDGDDDDEDDDGDDGENMIQATQDYYDEDEDMPDTGDA